MMHSDNENSPIANFTTVYDINFMAPDRLSSTVNDQSQQPPRHSLKKNS